MSTAQKIWDDAHPVKIGQTLQPGTEYVQVDGRDYYGWVKEVSIHTIREDELVEITDDYAVQFIRTIERQTDRIDTGTRGNPMSNALGRITVQVSTGDIFRSEWREDTAASAEEVRGYLSRVSDMRNFDIETDKGYTVYINPEHIVYTYVEIMEDTDGN